MDAGSIPAASTITCAILEISEKSNAIELVTELGPVTLEIDLIEKANLVAHF